jgi:hypothetical protein
VADLYEQVAPLTERTLNEEHRKVLEEGSLIAPDIIEERGYYSLTREQIDALVQGEVLSPLARKGTSWMAIPIYRPDLHKHGEIVRVEGVSANRKYMWPSGERTAIDIHPASIEQMDAEDVIYIGAEGIKKADAILSAARRENIKAVVLAFNGNWGWRSTVEGHKVANPDFHDLHLKDRKFYVVPDSDYRTNDLVAKGWDECARFVASKTGESKTYVAVVPPNGLEKQGADDYLARGGTLSELLTLAVSPSRSRTERTTEDQPPLIIKSGYHLIQEAKNGIPHLIVPILPEASIMLVAGHSGTLKTWHMLSLIADIATGKKWLDHPEMTLSSGPVNVLYVNKEMSGVILGERLGLMMKHERYKSMPDIEDILQNRVFTADEAILDLRLKEQRDRLEESILENSIRAVVLDSFSMCWSGDENSNSEVGSFYNHLRGMIERTAASFIPVHHLDKPQGNGRSKHPVMFSIRGAGQLVQQADAALILSKVDPHTIEPDCKQIAIVHAKARTSKEISAFVSQFQDHEGISVSMRYHSQYSESLTKSYSESGKDPVYMDSWLIEEARRTASFLSGGSGMRAKLWVRTARTNWDSPEKDKPSEALLLAGLERLAHKGEIFLLEDHPQHGPLYKLPDPVQPLEEKRVPSDEEVT